MNLAAIPLLLVALLMISAGGAVDTARLVLSGTHQIEVEEGAIVVGDADVTIPEGVEIRGPVYVIGGELAVSGRISGDLVQLAGTVIVGADGQIGDELRYVAGTLTVAEGAAVGRHTSIDITSGAPAPLRGLLTTLVLVVLLATAASLLAKKRVAALKNVADAATGHPVVTLTVGFLLALTLIAVFVFMALTLLLLPVAVLGAVVALITVGYGVLGWGHAVGTRLPIQSPGVATVVGVVVVVGGLQVLGLLPVIGDLVVAGMILSGLGAVVLTYFGVAPFRPAPLTD